MEAGTYKLHRRALVALNELSADERAQVLDRLSALVETPTGRWSAAVARKIPDEPSLYLVPINDSLRAIVRAVEGEQPEILDVVHRETLEYFTKAAAKNGK